MIPDAGESPLSEAEIAEVRQIARKRIGVWRSRAPYSTAALVLSCALVYPFLKGHLLHEYWESFGKYLIFVSMALLVVFVYCVGLFWSAWQLSAMWRRGKHNFDGEQRERRNEQASQMTVKWESNLPMRPLLVLMLLLSTVPAFAQTADASDAIIAQENAFWKSYVEGNTADLSNLLLPDFTNVEANIWNRDQVLTFIKQFHRHCTLAPVKLVDPQVMFLTPDIATLVYHATETPTCGARTLSGDTNISTVWLRRDGRWQMHLHTEYAVPPK